jgi:hypothetical protein
MGILIAKIKKNRRMAILIPVIFLVMVTIIAAVVLKWRSPESPWF